nr:hypothetical protein [Tanacetum cinerariifolium]
MPTLVEYMILFGADNRPPMLEKHLYDSWKSKMELYMQNKEHGRMILESAKHGLLIWPTIEENGMTRTNKYEELSAPEKIQANCDVKATNIILQGLPTDVYSLVNHHMVSKDLWERVQLLMQGTSLTKQERECKLVTVQPVQRIQSLFAAGTSGTRANISRIYGNNLEPAVVEGPVTQTLITHNAAYQANDLDAYDSDCDNFSTAKAVLMANLSSYGSDVLSEIRPMLYDGSVIAKETNVISIADSEEMLEEESRSKTLLKQSDSTVFEKKVNIKPINYAELNQSSKKSPTTRTV